MIYLKKEFLELIGNTPIINIDNLYLKLEYFNPSGSIKDRMSLRMIEDLERKGILSKGKTVIEATSGNTGISVSMICAIKGYKCIIVMKNNVTNERIKTIKSYGAKVILVDSNVEHIDEVAQKIADRTGCVFLNQCINENNYLGYEIMAQEIIDDLPEIDYLICGIGTGGTIYGLSRILKLHYKDLRVIGVLPENLCANEIYGIGSKIEDIKFDMTLVDEIYYVSNEDALQYKKIYSNKGLFFGNSSGAFLYVASLLDKEKNILIVIPDNGFKYLTKEA